MGKANIWSAWVFQNAPLTSNEASRDSSREVKRLLASTWDRLTGTSPDRAVASLLPISITQLGPPYILLHNTTTELFTEKNPWSFPVIWRSSCNAYDANQNREGQQRNERKSSIQSSFLWIPLWQPRTPGFLSLTGILRVIHSLPG